LFRLKCSAVYIIIIYITCMITLFIYLDGITICKNVMTMNDFPIYDSSKYIYCNNTNSTSTFICEKSRLHTIEYNNELIQIPIDMTVSEFQTFQCISSSAIYSSPISNRNLTICRHIGWRCELFPDESFELNSVYSDAWYHNPIYSFQKWVWISFSSIYQSYNHIYMSINPII